MYANRERETETRGCDGKHGISTVLLQSDGWILHCFPDGERQIEREAGRTQGVPRGFKEDENRGQLHREEERED